MSVGRGGGERTFIATAEVDVGGAGGLAGSDRGGFCGGRA